MTSSLRRPTRSHSWMEVIDMSVSGISPLHLAQAYHVRMDQMDMDELGPEVDRVTFKAYFGIPEDADEDPNYKHNPDFDLAELSHIKGVANV